MNTAGEPPSHRTGTRTGCVVEKTRAPAPDRASVSAYASHDTSQVPVHVVSHAPPSQLDPSHSGWPAGAPRGPHPILVHGVPGTSRWAAQKGKAARVSATRCSMHARMTCMTKDNRHYRSTTREWYCACCCVPNAVHLQWRLCVRGPALACQMHTHSRVADIRKLAKGHRR